MGVREEEETPRDAGRCNDVGGGSGGSGTRRVRVAVGEAGGSERRGSDGETRRRQHWTGFGLTNQRAIQ